MKQICQRMIAFSIRLLIAASVLLYIMSNAVFALDSIKPELQGAVLDGAVIRLSYNEPLKPDAVPSVENMYVRVDDNQSAVSGIRINNSVVEVTLAAAPGPAQSVWLTYLQGSPPLQDLSGNTADNLVDCPVTQPDTSVPLLVSAVASGRDVTLQYNETLDPGSVPGAANFVVKVNGVPAAISSTSVTAASLRIQVAEPIGAGQTVLVTYLKGGSPLKDTAGNAAANLYDVAAVNPSQSAAPEVVSAVVYSDTLQLTYNQNLNKLSIPAKGSFIVAADTQHVAISRLAVNGPVVSLTLYSPVTSSQTVTVSYQPPAVNPLVSSMGINAASFDNKIATNRTDDAPPLLLSSRVTDSTVRLVYNEPLLASSVPGAGSYSVFLDGVYKAVASVAVADATVSLRLAESPAANGILTVSYSMPDMNAVKDLSGNKADNLVQQQVARGNDSTKPALLRATLDGAVLTLSYNEPLSSASVPAVGSFAVTSGSTALTVTKAAISGSDLRLTLSGTAADGASVMVSYTQPATNPVKDLNGNEADSFSSITAGNASDHTLPTLTSAVVNGAAIKLTYSEALRTGTGFVPPSSSFSVLVGSSQRSITNVSVNGAVVTLTLSSAAAANNTVTLSYTPSGSSAIQDVSGNKAAPLTSQAVTNQTDLTVPTFIRASASYALVILTYSETLDSSEVPSASSFTVYGSTYRTVTSVAVNGLTVMLTLGTPVTTGETLTVSYSAPYSGGLQDLSGNLASSLYSQPVTTNGSDSTPPTISSATVSGSTITLTYNESLSSSGAPYGSQFTVMSGQSAISVSTVNISGSAVRLTLQSAPPSGQALKVSYSPTGGNPLKDSNGNQAAALTGYSITVPSTPVNITTVEGKGSTITVTFSRPLNESVMPDTADFSVTASNAVKRVSDVRISGSTLTLTVEGTLGTKQSVQLSYTPGAEQLQDEQGNMVAAFAGRAVNMGSAATGGSETSETAEESELTGPAPGGQKPGVVDVILAESAAAQSDETTEQGEAVAVYTVNSSSIADALQQMKGKTAFTIGLTVDGGDSKNVKTLIPAAAFSSVNKGSTVLFRVATQIGEYDFPITVVDTASIANQLKAAPGDVYIGIVIRAAGTGLTDEITSKAKAAGLEMLGSPIVYDTFVEAGGKSYALSSFNQYINRTMYITPETSLKDTTVVWYDPVSKQPVYVPALLDRTDGRTSAVIKHMTNGTYAAVKTNKQFTDMAAHWAKGDVQRLASKLIVSGVSASAFNPNKSISKAEFVTMLTRALGLYGTTDNLPYSDVAQQSWFHSPVATAYAAGLIDRAEQFHPNEPITRSDIAIMIYRAAEVTVGKIPLTNIDQPITGKYTDLRNLASEERNAITANVKIGLMTGSSETEFAPEESATRAQAAVILGRLMKYAGLLN